MAITLQDLIPSNEPNATPITDSIKTSLADALDAVPEGKRGAALGYIDEQGVLHGVVALNLGGHWTLWANADYHTGEKHFEGKAGVRFTW